LELIFLFIIGNNVEGPSSGVNIGPYYNRMNIMPISSGGLIAGNKSNMDRPILTIDIEPRPIDQAQSPS